MSTTEQNLVRLSEITVDSGRYNALLEEEIEASMRLESGALTLYAVCERAHFKRITVLEIYADRAAYRAHLQLPISRNTNKDPGYGTATGIERFPRPLIPGLRIK